MSSFFCLEMGGKATWMSRGTSKPVHTLYYRLVYSTTSEPVHTAQSLLQVSVQYYVMIIMFTHFLK